MVVVCFKAKVSEHKNSEKALQSRYFYRQKQAIRRKYNYYTLRQCFSSANPAWLTSDFCRPLSFGPRDLRDWALQTHDEF